jgi:hypothetical protein
LTPLPETQFGAGAGGEGAGGGDAAGGGGDDAGIARTGAGSRARSTASATQVGIRFVRLRMCSLDAAARRIEQLGSVITNLIRITHGPASRSCLREKRADERHRTGLRTPLWEQMRAPSAPQPAAAERLRRDTLTTRARSQYNGSGEGLGGPGRGERRLRPQPQLAPAFRACAHRAACWRSHARPVRVAPPLRSSCAPAAREAKTPRVPRALGAGQEDPAGRAPPPAQQRKVRTALHVTPRGLAVDAIHAGTSLCRHGRC